jgi:transaldolase
VTLWLASADPETISKLAGPGIFAGVITNPDVVAASGTGIDEFCPMALAQSSGLIFVQPPGETEDELIAACERITAFNRERIVVKIPATRQGLMAMSRLVRAGISVAATCLPTPALVIVAEAIGVRYIIPWAGMLEKRGIGDRQTVITEMQQILERQGTQSELIVGSYFPADLVRLARCGIRNSFIWDKDVSLFLDQPLAAEAAASFATAWRRISNESY